MILLGMLSCKTQEDLKQDRKDYGSRWDKIDEQLKEGFPERATASLDSLIIDARRNNDPIVATQAILRKINLKNIDLQDFINNQLPYLEEELDKTTDFVSTAFLNHTMAHVYKVIWESSREVIAIKIKGDDEVDGAYYKDKIDFHLQNALTEKTKNVTIKEVASFFNSKDYDASLTLFDFLMLEKISIFKSDVYTQLLGEEEQKTLVVHFYDLLIDKLESARQDRLAVEMKMDKIDYTDADLFELESIDAGKWSYIVDYHKAVKIKENASDLDRNSKVQSERLQESYSLLQKVRLEADSIYKHNAEAQILTIEKPNLSLNVESVLIPNEPSLLNVTYKGVETVYLRIYRLDKENYFSQDFGREFPNLNLDEKIVYNASLKLPESRYMYIPQSSEIEIPDLQPGFYGLAANTKSDFTTSEDSPLFYSSFLVSNYTINNFYDQRSKKVRLTCINRTTGEVVNGAKFTLYSKAYDRRDQKSKMKVVNEGIGSPEFTFVPDQNTSLIPFVEVNDEFYLMQNGIYTHDYQGSNYKTTAVFTDRAIYRPGQEVHFFGLTYNIDLNRLPSIFGSSQLEIDISDNFGNSITKLNLKTDQEGAYSGNFVIPDYVQNGNLNFRISGKGIKLNGYHGVRVEEYKRPKYKVEFGEVEGEVKLDSEIDVTATATSYTGIPIKGAKVTYKVYRSNWWPYFYRGYRSYYPTMGDNRTLISSGNTVSSDKGEIALKFTAERSLLTPQVKNYSYTVEIEVVDNTGETKMETKTINISGQAVFVKFEETKSLGQYEVITVNSENKPVDATINITILAKVKGSYKRDRYWQFPDTLIVDPMDYPNYSFDSPENSYVQKVYEAALSVKDTVSLGLKDLVGAGSFQIVLQASDEEAIKEYIQINDFNNNDFASDEMFYVEEGKDAYEIGEDVRIRVGSSIENLNVQVIKFKGNEVVEEEWSSINKPIVLEHPLTNNDYGGFSYLLKAFYKNRMYSKVINISVPWKNKKLTIIPKSIRYVTEPGAPEKWTFMVVDESKKPVQGNFLASMYDASLDQFQNHQWKMDIYPSFTGVPSFSKEGYGSNTMYPSNYQWNRAQLFVQPFQIIPQYDFYPQIFQRYESNLLYRSGAQGRVVQSAVPEVESMQMDEDGMSALGAGASKAKEMAVLPSPPPPPPPVRTNLAETVFFMPALKTDENGEVTFEFTNNEALTTWKLQNLVFTNDLKIGISQEEIITRKDLMIQANQPRFLRGGDEIQLSAKLMNLTDIDQKVQAQLTLFDEVNDKDIVIENSSKNLLIDKSGESEVFWKIKVPLDLKFLKLTYSVSGESHYDAEEHIVQVVPNEKFLIESQTVVLNANESKSVDLGKMLGDNKRVDALTIESTGSPVWYTIRALPYLIENEYQNAEAVFNRFFANSLALKIIDENPLIEKFYRSWKEKGELNSKLSEKQELKNLMLVSSPWLRNAISEEEVMDQIALLLDRENIELELKNTKRKLVNMQLQNGAFPWFPGGRPSLFISQYILEGILRLEELEITGFDDRFKERLTIACNEDVFRVFKKDSSGTVSLTVIKNVWINEMQEVALSDEYGAFISQVKKQLKMDWFKYGLEEQAYIAKIFIKSDRAFTMNIITSLKEKSFHKEELGRFWNKAEGMVYSSWDIGLQATMISLFNEVGQYESEIDDMKFWLISNKRTHQWSTSMATSSAIYALSLGATSSFKKGKPIVSKLDGEVVEVEDQSGLNYSKTTISDPGRIKSIKKVEFDNPNSNKAWANVYLQFYQDYEDIERRQGQFLDIRKEVYLVDSNDDLINVDGQNLSFGDRIRVRMIIEVDRPLQFVHVVDDRPSGAEPVETTSGYSWLSGLAYYLSVKDTQTHFFVDNLNKGKHVIEYDMFINNLGEYNSGVAEIQSFYAPEFNDYSKTVTIRVGE